MPDEDALPPHEQTTIRDPFAGQAQRPWPPPPGFVRRRPAGVPIGTTIALTTLALILVLGGFGFIIYSVNTQYTGALHAQVTAEARSTAQANLRAQQTRQAELIVTQTLIAQQADIYATATALAAGTVAAQANSDKATATATALQNLLAQATSGTPSLDDSLSDSKSPNGWDLRINAQNNTGCQFIDSAYHVKEALYGYLQPCFAQATNFQNFIYQATMVIDQGSQGGMLFRANSAQSQYYLFRIGTDGSYTLEVYNGNRLKTLSSGYTTAVITGTGQSNDLQVIARNKTIDLFVNSTFIASATDASYTSGQIGVVALDYSLPTEVEFTNAQVWAL
jgi:hypothetical protein